MDRSEAARILGSGPKARRYTRTYLICGTTFTATARRVFCSAICRAHDQTRRKTAVRRARSEQAATASV